MIRVSLRLPFVLLLLLSRGLLAQATSELTRVPTRIFGSEDKDIVVPRVTLPLGQKDGLAVQLLATFLEQSNLVRWPGIQADGTFSDTNSSYSAVLTILSRNQCRLDIADPLGVRSTRIDGAYGGIRERTGANHSLPNATASLGLSALPSLIEHLSDVTSSILDGGLVIVDGVTLHRFTLEVPSTSDTIPASAEDVGVVDLYFDQNMHQLRKSVELVRVDTRDRSYYLQSTTYRDYRQVNGSMMPFSLTQTLNGQRQWALQLSTIRINPTVETSYFRF